KPVGDDHHRLMKGNARGSSTAAQRPERIAGCVRDEVQQRPCSPLGTHRVLLLRDPGVRLSLLGTGKALCVRKHLTIADEKDGHQIAGTHRIGEASRASFGLVEALVHAGICAVEYQSGSADTALILAFFECRMTE